MMIVRKVLRDSKRRHQQVLKAALREAMDLAHVLVDKFGAEAVVLYGSLAQGRYFDATSDIDLAVKGIGDNYFKAYGHCIRLSAFDVDVRVYEDMPRSMKLRIDKEGRLLHAH